MVSLLDDVQSKKPHLRFGHRIWSCMTVIGYRFFRVGYGYTPKEAYDDWKRQSNG